MTDLLQRLGETLLTGQPEELKERTRQALNAGLSAKAILQQGMMPAMESLGERFSKGEAFLPELLFAAVKMNAATEVLRPAIVGEELRPLGTLLLGLAGSFLGGLLGNLLFGGRWDHPVTAGWIGSVLGSLLLLALLGRTRRPLFR